MSCALTALKSQGRITIINGTGIFFGARPRTAPQRRLRKWENVLSSIEHDILKGTYAPGRSLPRKKQLQALYGVCHESLSKALDALTQKGILVQRKASFEVLKSPKHRGHASICLVASGVAREKGDKGAAVLSGSSVSMQHMELITALENLCAKKDIYLEILGLAQNDASMSGLLETLRTRSGTMGLIVLPQESWMAAEPRSEEQGRFHNFLASLAQLKKPTAVLDEMGDSRLLLGRHFRAFSKASTRAGETIGWNLLTRGHRRIAYLSATHQFGWSIRRLRGLQRSFAETGMDRGVEPVIGEQISGLYDQALVSLDFSVRQYRNLLERCGVPRETLDAECTHYRMLHARIKARISLDRAALEAGRSVRGLFPDLGRNVTAPLLAQAFGNALAYVGGVAEMVFHKPLFENALGDRTITAWVCSNDAIALSAMRFLRSRSAGVPEELSVVGFDNVPESRYNGLTTYNFNYPNIAAEMLAFVLSPRSGPTAQPSSPVEIEGIFIERESTGKGKGKGDTGTR
jgi:DNA-binding LacI/PurR family transcriptional regulator